MKNALTHVQIKNAGDGKLQDGGGLILRKKAGSGKWIFRYSHLGKRREMGLGQWPVVSLSEARKTRDQWAAVLAAGNDPIESRRQQQAAAVAERDREDPTFAELVDLVFEARKDSLRGQGKRGRWRSPLDLYAIPAFGKKAGSKVSKWDIVQALRPIWRDKHPTAEKTIQRIRIVLRSARLMGFPTDTEIVDAAQEMLGVVNHETIPMRSVDWRDIPELYRSLGGTTAGRCNQWIILTLVRIDAAKRAALSEFDGDVWTVPSDRIKGLEGKVTDFRVPLPVQAVEFVNQARELEQQFLFPGQSGKKPITDAAVEKCLREVEAGGTPHGFRASFKTWVQETEACSWEVAETILNHKIGGKTERAYARSDLLDLRRVAMQKWADFVTGAEAKVVPLRGAQS